MLDQQHTVECIKTYSVSVDLLWQIVGDFYSPWHPLMKTCEQEKNCSVRRFRMSNDKTLYREQLVYKSNSEYCFCYKLLEGIEGINQYQAGVKIEAHGAGSSLKWWADIEAEAVRAEEVAKDTRFVLETGLHWLFQTVNHDFVPPVKLETLEGELLSKVDESVETVQVQSSVKIALSYARGHAVSENSLCLFLHGIGGSRHNWDEQLIAASKLMPCAAMDLRGYGDSQLGESPSTLEDYCNDIAAVAKHFACKQLILVGLSYGAWIATHFALYYADKLDALVLCGGCTGMSEAPETVRVNFLESRLKPMDAGQVPRDFADNVTAMISGPNASASHKKLIHQSMASIPEKTYRDALHCFTHPPGKHDFSKLSCPVLLMTGEHDQLAPPLEINSVALRMLKARREGDSPLPDIQFEAIKGAGHIANLEQPQSFNHHLLSFLSKTNGSSAVQ